MALLAERNEVLRDIISKRAPRAEVMHLKIGRRPTVLAAPPISLKHLLAQLMIGIQRELNPRPFGSQGTHDALRASARNSVFSG